MPTRPLSHEQRQARAQQEGAVAQRQAINQDYAQRRRAQHGADPRSTARWQRLARWCSTLHPYVPIYTVCTRASRCLPQRSIM